MAEHISSADLVAMSEHTEYRVHVSIRWTIMFDSMKSRSHSTTCPNSVASLLVVIDLLPGLCHCRQIEHESTTPCNCFRASAGIPAACRIECILLWDACHHLKCSWRNALVMSPTFPDFNNLNDLPRSNEDQSGFSGALPASSTTGTAAGISGSALPSSSASAGPMTACLRLAATASADSSTGAAPTMASSDGNWRGYFSVGCCIWWMKDLDEDVATEPNAVSNAFCLVFELPPTVVFWEEGKRGTFWEGNRVMSWRC